MKRKPASGSVPSDTDNADYQVGYGKPPKHTRFKRGHSGNPNGRPKGNRNFRTIAIEALNERVAINEGGRRRSVPMFEAILRVARNKALNGDLKAMDKIFQLSRDMSLMDEKTEELAREVKAAADEAIIASYLSRYVGTGSETCGDEDPLLTQETSKTKENDTNMSQENTDD